jgi:hypothetical protein
MILGYPAAQKDVRFANKLYPANTVTLDDDGRYVVGLPAAGTYEISLDAAPLGMRTYTAGYHAGENHYDLEINGALLRVRLTQDGDVPKEPVLVRVRGPRDPIQQLVTTFDKLFEIDGLPFGVYVVSASTTSGLVSLDQTVVLNDKLSSATVWLDVSHERRALHVETDNGTAVKQATIYAEGGSQTLQVPTGLFPLPPLPLRTRIIVTAPDLAPTCIVVTGATEEQATLVTHTANVELRFLRIAGQPGVASGDLFGINGATCGVPLEHVSGQLVSRGEYDAIIVKLPVGQLQIDHNGTRTIFDVPGPPVVVK